MLTAAVQVNEVVGVRCFVPHGISNAVRQAALCAAGENAVEVLAVKRRTPLQAAGSRRIATRQDFDAALEGRIVREVFDQLLCNVNTGHFAAVNARGEDDAGRPAAKLIDVQG